MSNIKQNMSNLEQNSQGVVQRPLVGIGVMIQNDRGEVLLGLRQGGHAAGEWGFPGGHLEFGETIFETAIRETLEETGLEVKNPTLISVGDVLRYIETEGKHYLNVGVKVSYIGGEPQLMEPDKCAEWRWFDLDNLPSPLLEGTSLMIRNYRAGVIYGGVI